MFWGRKKEKVLIVQQPFAARPQVLSDPAARLSAETLTAHPGFQYLLEKLKQQQSYFKALLEQRQHSDLKEVIFLQAAIFWSGWLLQQVEETLPALRGGQPSQMPEPEVAEAFRRAQEAVEEVGVK